VNAVDNIVVRTSEYFQFKQHFEEKKTAHLLCSVRNVITANSPVVNQVLFYNHHTKAFVQEKASQLKKEQLQPSFAALPFMNRYGRPRTTIHQTMPRGTNLRSTT